MNTHQPQPDVFRAVTVTVDGHAEVVHWPRSGDASVLRHLQTAVGGNVDVVSLHPDIDMWVNDEGLVMNMPINTLATNVAAMFGLTHQPYHGPAVFTGGIDGDGETLPLPVRESDNLVQLAALTRRYS